MADPKIAPRELFDASRLVLAVASSMPSGGGRALGYDVQRFAYSKDDLLLSLPSPRASETEERSPFRRILLAVAALLSLLVTSVIAVPQAAVGAVNDRISVGPVELTSEDLGAPTVGDTLVFSGEWDASAADPQPGDQFVIGLPPELGFDQALPFPLVGSDADGNPVVWGNCLTDPAAGLVTCELTDLVLDNPEDVRGTFEFTVSVIAATSETSVVFDLNGSPVSVEVPGGEGIDDGIVVPDEWSKSGSMNDNGWSMSWWIDLPGASLAGHDVVHIREQLSSNHVLCDPSGLAVHTVYGSDQRDVSGIATVVTEVDDPYDFEIVLEPGDEGFDAGVLYRISYQTCTPDGEIDEQGTEYTNEAFVDIWGQSSGVIGVEQPWAISDTISKSGSVLGGGARNGIVDWTVTVPGDVIAGTDPFVLSETLTGQHEVCAGTIDGIRVIERYGPSSSRQTDITGGVVVTTLSQSAQAFEVEIAPGDDVQFRPSDWMYLIRYQTCATTDGLPEGGTSFGNEAAIGPHVQGSEASVPGRTEGKSGGINASTVTLDGYDYLPQTTMNWSITVPGEYLAEFDGPVVVTDVLSGAHEVCAATDGSLSDRLGLSVQARDQISNGGLDMVDLTDGVSVEQDDSELTFVIDAPELVQPDGSTAVGFSREYQYRISYTTCTASGGMDSPGTSYGNAATVAGKTYTHGVEQTNRAGGTGQGMPRGTVAVSKSLADTPGAALVPAGTEFTVHVEEIDPAGVIQTSYDLRVPLDGDPVSGFNARGNGWTVALSEPSFPTIPGVIFGAPTFAAGDSVEVSDDGTRATAMLTPATNIEVELTNTALLGAVEVTKVLTGGAADLVETDRDYTITASIDVSDLPGVPAQDDRELTLEAGEIAVLDELPIGATVTFSEDVPVDDDRFTWAEPVFAPASIVVGEDSGEDPERVTVTNHVERTVGTFSVSKQVEGAEADNPAAPAEFTVLATWDDDGTPGEKVLTLPADGTAVPLGEQLLIGTEVTLTEEVPADGSGIAWSAAIWAGTGVRIDGESAVVTIGRDADASVTVTNHAATSTAGISLIKGIAGEAAGEVDASTEFPIVATWVDADGQDQSVELAINALSPTPLGVELPAGTVVTITEGERPGIDTVVWGSITISGDDVDDAGDGSAQIVVSDQQDDVTFVTVVNEATWAPGGFSIAKSIEGIADGHPDYPETVTVTATWVDADGAPRSQEISVPADGTSVDFPESLPHGTEVTLVESPLEPTAQFTWAAPVWSGERVVAGDGDTATVTIGAADVVAIALTNTAVASTGAVEIVKSVVGTGAGAVAGTDFPVVVTWTDLLGEEQTRDVVVSVETPTVITDVPLGTEVRIAEHDGSLPGGVRWAGVDWTAVESVELIEGEESAQVTAVLVGDPGSRSIVELENVIEERTGLAVTGGTVAVWAAGIGALVLLAGAFLLLLRRRRA